MTAPLRHALEQVCADLERFDPQAPSLHFARGIMAAGLVEPPLIHGSRRIFANMDEVIADYQGGMTLTEVGDKYGSSYMTIQRRLIECGVAIRPRTKRAKPPKTPKHVASPEMIADYEGGMSLLGVAGKHGGATNTVRDLLHRAGVAIRPKGNRSNLSDPAQIDRIMELRADGMNAGQVGKVIGVTRERVRQIVTKAGRKAEWGEEKPLTFEQREAIDRYSEGMSLALAANKAGVCLDTFRKYLRNAGVTIRPSAKFMHRREKADLKAAQVARLYQEGLSGEEIAAAAGLPNKEATYRHLARAGIAPDRLPNAGKVLT